DRLRGLNGRADAAPPPPLSKAPPSAKPMPAMAQSAQAAPAGVPEAHTAPAQPSISVRNASVADAVPRIYPLAIQRIDTEVAAKLERDELARQLTDVVSEIIVELKLQLNHAE